MPECIFEGGGWGLGAEPLKLFMNTPLGCKKTLFRASKYILGRIGFLLYDVIRQQKSGGAASSPVPACLTLIFSKNIRRKI